ncbi:cytochrome P450 [Mycena rosella]|uniref:Cytochrome P450 n=1 Tax=Mycena rosella TaxID=1033263 RepID=A0AAD7GU45_MYCRO|nr:cytochrome P450 [Mycena rosella]
MLVRRYNRRRSTQLKGPSDGNFLFGMMPLLLDAPDSGALYEEWANVYGSVFAVPSILGSKNVVFTDPKAIIHYYNKDTYGYVGAPPSKRHFDRLVGRGLVWAEGNSHKGQRRALNPAFSNTSIKSLTPIFFDSAYKAKVMWDAMIESSLSDGTVIEDQNCLDTIGLAGFNHDFTALSGRPSAIASAFDSTGSKPSLMDTVVLVLSMMLPIFDYIPTGRREMLNNLAKIMKEIGDEFIARTSADSTLEKSVVGLLGALSLTQRLSCAQINVLLLGGYETTSELARNSDMQSKLREEILRVGRDPTYEELTTSLPFLDAFVCEVLRMYPALGAQDRMAAEDDVLPLSAPIETANGELVDSIFLSKGTTVKPPIQCMNRSLAFWGPDAKVFKLERWLDDTAVLSVLVRSFTFEFPNGPETKLGLHMHLLPRPKVEGEVGYRVPLLIRQHAQ